MEDFNFGGKNKARRLARMIRKGKTEKAQKLAAKIQTKVAKLEEKGKIDKKRYATLMAALQSAGEAGLTLAEQEELGDMQDMIEEGDPELKKGIDDIDKEWYKKPITYIIGGSVLVGLTAITIILIKVLKPKKAK